MVIFILIITMIWDILHLLIMLEWSFILAPTVVSSVAFLIEQFIVTANITTTAKDGVIIHL